MKRNLSQSIILSCFLILLGFIVAFSIINSDDDSDFPDRPVILICPWSAGGGTDQVSRQLAVGLERELGVPVNVVNATGASGVTGHTRGAIATPDGYTITLATAELNMLHWRGLTNITYEDFQPAVLLNQDPAALFVRKDSPWNTLQELNNHILEGSDTLQASGTALGGIWHIAMAGWLDAIGAKTDDVRWISIEGSNPSLQELMAGGLDLVFCSLPEAQSLLKAGEIRCLGVMGEERLDRFPEIPTFQEQKVDVALGTWRGVVLPLGVPKERADILTQALETVVNDDMFRDFMRRSGFNWTFRNEEGFRNFLAQRDKDFGKVLTSEAFKKIGDKIIGPMAFPIVLFIIGISTFTWLLMTGQFTPNDSVEKYTLQKVARILEILLAIAVFLLAAKPIGFVLTASSIVFLLMWRLGIKLHIGFLVSLVMSVGIYHIFAVLLRVPLPRGIFGW